MYVCLFESNRRGDLVAACLCTFGLFFLASDVRNQAAKLGRVDGPDVAAAGLLLLRFCCCEFYTCNSFQETPARAKRKFSENLEGERVFFIIIMNSRFS